MNFKETLAEKTVHAEDVLTKYLPEEKGYQDVYKRQGKRRSSG